MGLADNKSSRTELFLNGEIKQLGLLDILINSDSLLHDLKKGSILLTEYASQKGMNYEKLIETANIKKFSGEQYGIPITNLDFYLSLLAIDTTISGRKNKAITRNTANVLSDRSSFGAYTLEFLAEEGALGKETQTMPITKRYVPETVLPQFEENRARLDSKKISNLELYYITDKTVYTQLKNEAVQFIGEAVKRIGRQHINHLGLGNILFGLEERTERLLKNRTLQNETVTINGKNYELTHHLDSEYSVPYKSTPLFLSGCTKPKVFCTICEPETIQIGNRTITNHYYAEKTYDIFTLHADRFNINIVPFIDGEKQETEKAEISALTLIEPELSPVYKCRNCGTHYFNQ